MKDEITTDVVWHEETERKLAEERAKSFKDNLKPLDSDYSTFGFVNRMDEHGRSKRGLAL